MKVAFNSFYLKMCLISIKFVEELCGIKQIVIHLGIGSCQQKRLQTDTLLIFSYQLYLNSSYAFKFKQTRVSYAPNKLFFAHKQL